MSRGFPLAWLAGGCALAAAAGAAGLVHGWAGPGWYQVSASEGGRRLQAGPYKTELACKKAMNSASPELACLEIREAPAAGR